MAKYWFKPKKYGIGAMPSSKEGWFVIIAFSALIVWRAILLETNLPKFYVELIVLVIILVWIAKVKTDGEWKWRWG